MALLVYVDDVLLASDSILEIERLKTFLDAKFTIKDLGPLNTLLAWKLQGPRLVSPYANESLYLTYLKTLV